MKSRPAAFVCALVLLCPIASTRAETVALRSGKEVEIIDGALTLKGSEEVAGEAAEWLRKGRLDYAREYWKLLVERGQGAPVARARSAQARLENVEYESFVILGNGKKFRGKIKANLRSDLLGLEGKEEIPLWQIEEIAAEYHPGLSQVSKTFYPLTLLEIKLRGRKLQIAKTTSEMEFLVETSGGEVGRALLGKSYQFMRPEDLANQLEAATRDRIVKVVIYPGLVGAE